MLVEDLQPLGHLPVGAALDDVLHHGALQEQHAEADVDGHSVRIHLADLQAGRVLIQ